MQDLICYNLLFPVILIYRFDAKFFVLCNILHADYCFLYISFFVNFNLLYLYFAAYAVFNLLFFFSLFFFSVAVLVTFYNEYQWPLFKRV